MDFPLVSLMWRPLDILNRLWNRVQASRVYTNISLGGAVNSICYVWVNMSVSLTASVCWDACVDLWNFLQCSLRLLRRSSPPFIMWISANATLPQTIWHIQTYTHFCMVVNVKTLIEIIYSPSPCRLLGLNFNLYLSLMYCLSLTLTKT